LAGKGKAGWLINHNITIYAFRLFCSMEVHQALSKEDFIACWQVMKELRPNLTEDTYLALILHMLDEGYKMIYIKHEDQVASCCGYRYETQLHRGKSIYIDDLVTAPTARGKGFGGALLKYVFDEAREAGCQSVHLDSGVQRFAAHRLYLNNGFNITSHHFALEL
jgi:GNAT superfamily N-acetyltransferase